VVALRQNESTKIKVSMVEREREKGSEICFSDGYIGDAGCKDYRDVGERELRLREWIN
jgi:hypothetical protein